MGLLLRATASGVVLQYLLCPNKSLLYNTSMCVAVQEFRAFSHGGKPKVLVMSYPCFRIHKAEVYRMGLDVVRMAAGWPASSCNATKPVPLFIYQCSRPSCLSAF